MQESQAESPRSALLQQYLFFVLSNEAKLPHADCTRSTHDLTSIAILTA
jgi:hypothetical protein